MKKTKVTLDDVLTLSNLRSAYKEVMKTCKNKKGKFLYNLYNNINIENLYKSLVDGTYEPSRYIIFPIFEPKARLVMSQNITDKIVNHFIAKFILIPNLESKLNDNNIATRKNKGSSYGNKLMTKYINTLRQKGNVYCLKLDISKYFYNIDHNILINKVINDGIDSKTINIISKLINETNKEYINDKINNINVLYDIDLPLYRKGIGLSIGAVINQFLAIYYINDVIKYIKEDLHIKEVICYMDDIIVLHNDKEYLKVIRKNIEIVIESLKLSVNPKSTICSLKNGINFLGFKHYERNNKYYVGFKKKTINKINDRLSYLKKYNLIKYYKSVSSYYGYFLFVRKNEGCVFKLKNKDKYKIYKDKFPNSIIFFKEGSFYKCYYDDALIIWYLFNYMYIDDNVSFGSKAYDKVFDELNRLHISYVCITEEEIVNSFDNNVYDIYSKLSKDNFEYKKKIDSIKKRIEYIIGLDINNYEKINKYLNNLE